MIVVHALSYSEKNRVYVIIQLLAIKLCYTEKVCLHYFIPLERFADFLGTQLPRRRSVALCYSQSPKMQHKVLYYFFFLILSPCACMSY